MNSWDTRTVTIILSGSLYTYTLPYTSYSVTASINLRINTGEDYVLIHPHKPI
jgi:hypothetical protein